MGGIALIYLIYFLLIEKWCFLYKRSSVELHFTFGIIEKPKLSSLCSKRRGKGIQVHKCHVVFRLIPLRSWTMFAVPSFVTISATRWWTTATLTSGMSWRCPAGQRWSCLDRVPIFSSPWWVKATVTGWHFLPVVPSATTGSEACWKHTRWESSYTGTPCNPAYCHFLERWR